MVSMQYVSMVDEFISEHYVLMTFELMGFKKDAY